MDLNLIYPGKEYGTAVKGLEDNWLISGPIRATMHLAGVWWTLEPQWFKKETANTYSLDGKNVFGPHFKDHEWVRWAAQSEANYNWLYFYACALCDEYVVRFDHLKRHGIASMLKLFEDMPESVPEGIWTPPEFAAGIEFKE